MNRIIVIAGPTASGKSDIAMKLAGKMDAVIINADSQQVYKEIPIITAQPTAAEKNKVPHKLYGFLSAAEKCSAGLWLKKAKDVMDMALLDDKVPILVGGTGLYIKCLMYGMAAIPDIASDIRTGARDLIKRIGVNALYEMLSKRDGATAERLNPEDSHRILRAWEVIEQTGTSLDEWQKKPHKVFFLPEQFDGYFINPPRQELYARINRRFIKMTEGKAMDEIKKLDKMNLDPTLPAMKAYGVPELLAHLHGELDLGKAIEQASQNTRNYAKRQITFFKNQLPEFQEITSPEALV